MPETKERKRERARRFEQKNPFRYLKRYGITEDDLSDMLAAQGDCCAICGEYFTEAHPACVDHDHATGKVRGLLCWRCNPGIGQFRDRPGLLRAAAAYLERTKEPA
jgi:hypothetical protein